MAYEELYGVLSSAEFARFMVKKHVANKITLSFVLLFLVFFMIIVVVFLATKTKTLGIHYLTRKRLVL